MIPLNFQKTGRASHCQVSALRTFPSDGQLTDAEKTCCREESPESLEVEAPMNGDRIAENVKERVLRLRECFQCNWPCLVIVLAFREFISIHMFTNYESRH